LDRIFMCSFLSFGLALSGKKAAIGFLLGRFLGLVLLGFLFTLVGFKFFPIPHKYLHIIFGVFIIVLGAMMLLRKPGHKHNKLNNKIGFGLGLFRGALNPGRKLFVLFPLLIGVSIPKGLLISATYALSSSVYLVLGIIGGAALTRVFAYRRVITLVGAVILIGLGLFYISRGLGLFCIGRGMAS